MNIRVLGPRGQPGGFDGRCRQVAVALHLAAATAGAVAAETPAVETIVVTGKAGWLDAQPPGSRTVLDAAQWRALGMPDLPASLAVLPGVQANRNESGQSLPTLRGIGTVTSGTLLGTQQATTGLYLDDLPLTDPFGFVGTPDFSGFELSRIQVLRGPQAVLHGSASLGGAIDVGLVMPRVGDAGAFGRLRLDQPRGGSPGWGLAAAWTASDGPDGAAGPADRAWRLEAYGQRIGGIVDNRGTGTADADRLQRSGVRAAFVWTPARQIEWRAQVLHQRSEADDSAAVWPDIELRQTRTPSASTRRDGLTLAKADLVAALPRELTLSATLGWVDKRAERATDLTRSLGGIGRGVGAVLGIGALPDLPQVSSVTLAPTRSVALSQELRLQGGQPDGARWLLGVFAQQTRFDNLSRSIAPGGARLWGPFGFLLPAGEIGQLDVAARATEAAVFGEASWPLGPAWRATAGARAYRAAVDYDASLRYLGRTSSGSPATADDGLMPRLSLQHEGMGYSAYALVSRGYRVGGVNFNPPAFTPYRSDRLLNRELGLRLAPGGALRAELTGFDMAWRDAQVSALTTEPVPLIGVANVGRARSRGVEAALTATTAERTTWGLRLAGIDARTLAAFTTASGQPVPAGARLPGTPRWHAAAEVSRPFAIGAGWTGQATADLTARSARVEAIGGDTTSPGRALLGAGLSARKAGWTLQLRWDNLGDVADVAGAEVVDRTGLPPLTDRYLSTPRRWTLTVRHEL